eukprot:4587392-Prymnesium_polylepis.1
MFNDPKFFFEAIDKDPKFILPIGGIAGAVDGMFTEGMGIATLIDSTGMATRIHAYLCTKSLYNVICTKAIASKA